jgi:putative methionine-R-sulfoxide reductase with GAF domain
MPIMSGSRRDYAAMAAGPWSDGPLEQRMEQALERLWPGLRDLGVSWIGFYLERPEEPEDRCLELGPHRDRPACSPIGLHGVCGQALIAGQTRIVRDVQALGDAYIACDPRDRSEIVIPLPARPGEPRSVLDADSWEVDAFDRRDDQGLRRVLEAAGLLD